MPLACSDPDRVRSACLVYGPDGRRVARYDKIHLFAFARGEERYDEGSTIEPGTDIAGVDLPCGRVGLSVCYDVRFPELYRRMGTLALILVPAAFTATTGAAHWHLLLRARAVENQCYVLAAAQGGLHPSGRRTYGHSVLIDPWGAIVAERAEGTGIVVGDVDPGVTRARARGVAGAHAPRAVGDSGPPMRAPRTHAGPAFRSTTVTSRISFPAPSRSSGRSPSTRRRSSRSRASSIRNRSTRTRRPPRRGHSAV